MVLPAWSPPMIADSISSSVYEDYMEVAAEDGASSDMLNEELEQLHENQINLNQASREELESIPFLNNEQIENLAYYLYRYGPIVSLSELKLVEGLDEQLIEKIAPILYVDTTQVIEEKKRNLKEMLRFGKQDIRATFARTVEKSRGYLSDKDSVKMFMGDPNALEWRYSFNYKRLIQFGFLLEKDPGEPYFHRPSKSLLDGKSFHLLIKTSSRLRALAIGDYKIRFGEGLICNQGFLSFKNAPSVSFEQTGGVINKHHSASPLNHFTGIAGSYSLLDNQNALLTLFYSQRALDSNLDSMGFSSIQTDNLHRTDKELANRKNIRQSAYGANMTFQWYQHQWGISFIEHTYDQLRYVNAESFRPKSYEGKVFRNFALHGKTNISNMHVYGEFALDKTFHSAKILGLDLKVHKKMDLNLLWCDYDPQYTAEFAQSSGFRSTVCNERSLTCKVYYHPMAFWHVFCMVSLARFPASRFQTLGPTSGRKFTADITKKSRNSGEFKLKFAQRYTEQNSMSDQQKNPMIESEILHQLKMQYTKKEKQFITKSTLEINRSDFLKQHHWGIALGQDFGFQIDKNNGFQWHLALFKTETYANKIYFLEKSIPGSFSIPALYGNGLKQSFYVFSKFKKTTMRIQYQFSYQPKDKTTGSGYDQISGNRKNQWGIQCVHTW